MPDATATSLRALALSKKWSDLDAAWQAAIESDDADPNDLLACLEIAIKSGQAEWAETSAWAWLTLLKEHESAAEALHHARELLLRLPDGSELRGEVLELYRKTHTDTPDLETWIQRSGLSGGASVRKALRYLDVALQLKPGACLLHRTEDIAAEITALDLAADSLELRTTRGMRSLSIDKAVDDYQPAHADDFRVLRQLRPERLKELAQKDPLSLAISVLRGRNGRIDRDEMRVLLVPQVIAADVWGDWWTRLRNAVKKSPHVTIEGRSPMFLVYHEAGQTVEEEALALFQQAHTPRELLLAVEGYLRDSRGRGASPDAAFLHKLARALDQRVKKLARHDPDQAFATALVIERLGEEGLPLPPDVHGIALRMIARSDHPAGLVLSIPDAAIWPLALKVVRQALPGKWPEVFAQVLPDAPTNQCDALCRAIEDAGRGAELLQPAIDDVLADPAEHIDAFMWLWKGPEAATPLKLPPPMDLLNRILSMVGPARNAARSRGGNVTQLRGSVRAGLSARDYARFRQCLEGLDEAVGTAVRRQIERAEGLGPVVQGEMQDIIREMFPKLFVRARVEPWDEPGVLYVTEAGLRKKEAERDELVNVKMRENAIAIGRAAEHGDLSENSEYKFALEERDLLRARLAQINEEMSMARPLNRDELPTDHVSIGHRVTLAGADGNGSRVLTILGPWESDIGAGIYSYQAPLVRRLLGLKIGDTVSLPDAEGANEREYRIESIEPAI